MKERIVFWRKILSACIVCTKSHMKSRAKNITYLMLQIASHCGNSILSYFIHINNQWFDEISMKMTEWWCGLNLVALLGPILLCNIESTYIRKKVNLKNFVDHKYSIDMGDTIDLICALAHEDWEWHIIFIFLVLLSIFGSNKALLIMEKLPYWFCWLEN